MTDLEKDGGDSSRSTIGRKLALAMASVTGFVAVSLSVISWPFVAPAFRKVCLPYVPASSQQVKNVMLGLCGRKGPLIDLGSGDGRIVLSAASAGFQSVGVELNPWLVIYSRLMSWRLGLGATARFQRTDLFTVDLRCYDNVVIFGVEQMMPSVERLLSEQLRSSACVIACRFPLPSWKPCSVLGDGIDAVWVYTPPKRASS